MVVVYVCSCTCSYGFICCRALSYVFVCGHKLSVGVFVCVCLLVVHDCFYMFIWFVRCSVVCLCLLVLLDAFDCLSFVVLSYSYVIIVVHT